MFKPETTFRLKAIDFATDAMFRAGANVRGLLSVAHC